MTQELIIGLKKAITELEFSNDYIFEEEVIGWKTEQMDPS